MDVCFATECPGCDVAIRTPCRESDSNPPNSHRASATADEATADECVGEAPENGGSELFRLVHGGDLVRHSGMEIFRLSDVLLHGQSPRRLQRSAERGDLHRLHHGIYGLPPGDSEARWLQQLTANLARGGPTSAISHRAAAMLHRLEGFYNEPGYDDVLRHHDTTIAVSSGWKTAPAIRSATLRPNDITIINGVRVTSLGRTLADLGRFVTADRLEFAVEHALRGDDRRRPDLWNEDLLAELQARTAQSRQPGAVVLRTVLTRRGLQRPTGSYVETMLVQGMRTMGIELQRQPTIDICNRRGRLLHRYFPDFADLQVGLLPEIDGRLGHTGDDKIDRDDRRQNELIRGFHVIRFHAFRVKHNPMSVAKEIVSVRASLPTRPDRWQAHGVTVERTADGARLTR